MTVLVPPPPHPMSSFTALRNSFKRAAVGAALPKSKPSPAFRRFNTTNAAPPPPPPPAAKSGSGLYVGIGAVIAAGGVAYYLFDGAGQAEQILAARKTTFVPTQEDYQKVGSYRTFLLFRVINNSAGLQQNC